MTNPENIVRVRARKGGRASVYEANAWCQAFTMGVLSGTGAQINDPADMTVLVGNTLSKPDVVIAETPAGYKVALDLVGQQPVEITAPSANTRRSAIVAYTNDISDPTNQTDITGSPSSCGLIVVNGDTGSSATTPTDAQIRAAITADGGTGSQAAYAIIATVDVPSSTTAIASVSKKASGLLSAAIASSAISSGKIASKAVTTAKINDKAVTAAQVADKTLTATQLADKTVTAAKIADATITPAKMTANFIKVQSTDPGAGVAWPDSNAILIAVI